MISLLKYLKSTMRMKNPLPKMSIQNINEYLKEGCGIIASKQLPKTGFNHRRKSSDLNDFGKRTPSLYSFYLDDYYCL